jgi:Sortase domain
MKLLNVLVVALIAAGVALAVTGKSTLRWAPPPLPQKWEAPAAQLARPPPAAAARGPTARQLPRQYRQYRQYRQRSQLSRDERNGAHPEAPATRTQSQVSEPSPAAPAAPAPVVAAAPMSRSLPVSVKIPAIGVRASLLRLGLQANGAIAVPPLTRPFLAGWFDQGPTPGQRGTAVIVGHVDAAGVGPAVFYELGDLRPGDRIYVTLADRRTAVFAVWAAALYSKADFPTATVYGYTSRPSLRLITCGGIFDPQTGHYLSNIVVFADYLGQV